MATDSNAAQSPAQTGAKPAHKSSESGGPVIWIVSTGTEILQGHYPDTNAQWLSKELFGLGLRVDRHMALPDDHDRLYEQLVHACQNCDLVIMTGGLGPTADDMNRQSIANVFGVELYEDQATVEFIEELFTSRGRVMPPSNKVQALFPEGAQIIPNRWGTAPGLFIEPRPESGLRASLLAMPGPPREMHPVFESVAADIILKHFGEGRPTMRTLTIHTVSVAESYLNDRMTDLWDRDPKVGVALLAGRWRVDVRLTLQGETDAENDYLQDEWIDLICDRIGEDNIYGLNEVTLPAAIGKILKENSEFLTFAESCTGGLIAKQISDVAGCSEYFSESFITYSNTAKRRTLGVAKEILEEHGAVSGPTVEAMAAGAREKAGADWALSVSGIAGPTGGTADKPVGTVYFGLALPDGTTRHRRIQALGADRDAVREFTAVAAQDYLRRAMLGAGDPPGFGERAKK